MPIIGAKGSPSSGGFGQFAQASAAPNYIEDVFSTWLYTGNGSTQTINNGIDLAGKGGLVWIKWRSGGGLGSSDNALYDTTRGVNNLLVSNSTAAQVNTGTGSNASVSAFNSNGFSLGADALYGRVNYLNGLFASWTFRKQPKFFDCVTYTGNGTSQNIAHSLGSVPGCIIVKDVSNTRAWSVYHTSLGNTQNLILSGTNAAATAADWNNTTPTSTVFTVGTNVRTNASGATYVAYLFAHNAGGFGLTGTDNVISCGSFTQASGGTTVNLGFEPQWVMVKNSSGTGNWFIFDNMRGNSNTLIPNLSNAEGDQGAGSFQYNATGFTMADYITGAVGSNLIYIAIRRGPMKTPTTGTSVFSPAVSAGSTGTKITTDFPVDLQFSHSRSFSDIWWWADRLRGMNSPGLSSNSLYLSSNNTNAEATSPGVTNAWDNNSFSLGSAFSGQAQAYFNLRRAPGFFDEVCYTGDSTLPRTINHNLGVAPELIINKRRDNTSDWSVYCSYLSGGADSVIFLSSTSAQSATGRWNNTAPTSTTFSIFGLNQAGATFVNYLFATCPGVSKVGSYTGTGTTQTINCGFTGGSRFVLIKRTDSTGDWYVWDSARGIVAGNDPYLLLNSTAAEVTNTDFVDTASTGFEISSTAPAAINASGGTFIFLAIS